MILSVVYMDVCANTFLFHPFKLTKKIVICVQTCYYYTHYLSDPWYIKFLVSLYQFLLVLSQSCIAGRCCFCFRDLLPGNDYAHEQVQSPPTGISVFIRL